MHVARTALALSLAALAVGCASPGTTNTPPAAPAMAGMNASAVEPMRGMDARMKTMQEMHQKMMAAQSPAERQALMAEHTKAMQGGMAMMKDMHGPGGMGAMGAMPMAGMGDGKAMPAEMAQHHKMMADHMAMMQMMMDMMGDRMPPTPMSK